jgi:hypothetical protein
MKRMGSAGGSTCRRSRTLWSESDSGGGVCLPESRHDKWDSQTKRRQGPQATSLTHWNHWYFQRAVVTSSYPRMLLHLPLHVCNNWNKMGLLIRVTFWSLGGLRKKWFSPYRIVKFSSGWGIYTFLLFWWARVLGVLMTYVIYSSPCVFSYILWPCFHNVLCLDKITPFYVKSF